MKKEHSLLNILNKFHTKFIVIIWGKKIRIKLNNKK